MSEEKAPEVRLACPRGPIAHASPAASSGEQQAYGSPAWTLPRSLCSPGSLQAAAPAQNPFAALGGSGTAASGFGGGFTFGVATPAFAAPKADAEDGDEDGDEGAAEEECQAEFKPLVQLEEVETSTGEEEETCLFEW